MQASMDFNILIDITEAKEKESECKNRIVSISLSGVRV